MKKLGKWIGAGLGWTIGGPIGAVLGFAVGSFVDAASLEAQVYARQGTTTGDFIVSLLVIIASAMKADQRVMKSELDFVKEYLTKSFGKENATEMIRMLSDILKQDIPIREVTGQIRARMDYPSRLQLLHLIFGIAMSDGTITEPEVIQMEQIAADLGIRSADIHSIKNMFIRSTDWAYQILEIDRKATNDAVKKAYHHLAIKNHPDKVAYLGDEIRQKAQEKFQKISEAYEAVKKERGIN
jgi:DnaJ like chaperone protein